MGLLTSVFRQLLSMAAMALPVMAVVLLLRSCLRKAPKKYSYALWLVVALRLACPILPESPVGLPQLETVEEAISAVMSGEITQAAEPAVPAADWNEDAAPPVSAQTAPEPAAQEMPSAPAPSAAGGSDRRSIDQMQAAALVWLAGLAGMLAYIAVSDVRLRRRVATAILREENIWECGGISTPFVLGLFRPRIYMPFRMTEAQRLYVLAHERHHIRRKDHWAKALALLLLAAYWWDPAVWLCWTLFCRDMEMSCDEAVLARLGGQARQDYSLSLVSFALDRRAPMALAFGEHDASRRVKNVLKWKEARPAVTFLALAAVVLATVVCGTDAERADNTWVRGGTGADSGSITYHFSENVNSYAICQEVYHKGKLAAPTTAMMFDNMEDLGGVTRREGTFSLELQTTGQDLAGSAMVIRHEGTTATFDRLLAADFPECDALSWSWREGRTELPDDGSVIIGAVYYDDGQEQYAWDCVTLEERGMFGTLKDNEWAVVLRLVVSTGDTDQLETGLRTIGLAQTLYDLRTDSAADTEVVQGLLEALGAGTLGTYELSVFREEGDTVLRVAFAAALDGAGESEMWTIAQMLLALVGDLDRVDYAFPAEDGSGLMTFYCNSDSADSWAEGRGYGDLKEAASTVTGIRALLDYLGWDGPSMPQADPLEQMARALFALRPESPGERPDVEKMLEILYTDTLGTYIVAWGEDGAARVDFGSLAVGGGTLRLGMQKRAAVMTALCPELRVGWTYEDPDSGARMTETAGAALRDDWTVSLGTAALSEETVIEGLRTLLEDLYMYDLFTLLQRQEAPEAFRQLLNAGLWGGAPGDLSLPDWSLSGGVLNLRFQNAPADPDAFDIYLSKTAFVLMYVKPEEVAKVAWSYPGTDGGTVERLVDQAEKFTVAGLFADYEAATVCPVTSQSELERLIRFAGLDGRVYKIWMERSAGIVTETFTDILGYDGFTTTETGPHAWKLRTYYAVTEDKTFPIAETYGMPEEYLVDLDGDGQEELVCNTASISGVRNVIVYQRRDDEIWRGAIDAEALPGFVNEGTGPSCWGEYDPEEDLFRIYYRMEGQDGYARTEARGMERLEFYPYT